jgi:STE24 endopeptidase
MAQTIFYIIITILIVDYFFERILEYLNFKRRYSNVPKELEGIYDAEKYKKQQEYKKVNFKFSLVTSTFSFIIILLMLLYNGFAYVDNIAHNFTSNPIFLALIFFGLLFFVFDIINTPFSLYDTFVIEKKFGFNKTSIKTFIIDKLKSWLLAIIIGGGLISLIIWFYLKTTNMFWIYAWILVSVFSVFFTMFYSSIIVPLFNKQTPLEEGNLRAEISSFSEKVGFKLMNIFSIDGSKRSTKANAYFSGLGAKKRIVLFDTLIKDLKVTEIVAVLAHEIGHYKKKHTLINIIISVFQTGLTFFILSLFIGNPALSQALGVENASFHIALISFAILYSPISTFLGLAMNVISRKNEFEADKFAGENYSPIELSSALKKLSINSLSNLTPHPFYVFVYYSHPPLLDRLKQLSNIELEKL